MAPAYAQHRLALQTLQSRPAHRPLDPQDAQPPVAPRGPAGRLPRRPDHLDPPGPRAGGDLAGQPGQRRPAAPDQPARPPPDGRGVEAQVRRSPWARPWPSTSGRPTGWCQHVHYDALMADPVGTVRALYRSVGDEVSDLHARRMESFLEHRPKDAFGRHALRPGRLRLDLPRPGRGVRRLHPSLRRGPGDARGLSGAVARARPSGAARRRPRPGPRASPGPTPGLP